MLVLVLVFVLVLVLVSVYVLVRVYHLNQQPWYTSYELPEYVVAYS